MVKAWTGSVKTVLTKPREKISLLIQVDLFPDLITG